MDSITFIANYPRYVDELENVIRLEFRSSLDQLRNLDPHDLVTPESWFPDELAARGLVLVLFLNELKKSKTISSK